MIFRGDTAKIIAVILMGLGFIVAAAYAGSLAPLGAVSGTMHSLAELYDSIVGTFDSTSVVANQNGSLAEQLKYIEANMGGGGVSSNSLDFDEFVDSMNLDANTSIASHGYTLGIMGNVTVGTEASVLGPYYGDLVANHNITSDISNGGGWSSFIANTYIDSGDALTGAFEGAHISAGLAGLGDFSGASLEGANIYATDNTGMVGGISALGAFAAGQGPSGHVPLLVAGTFQSDTNGGATDDMFGLRVINSAAVGSSVSNLYGIFLNQNSVGGAVGRGYALYSSSSFPSAFFGNVGIASSSPSEKLAVEGNIRLKNGSLQIGTGEYSFGFGFGGGEYGVEVAMRGGSVLGTGAGIQSSYIMDDSGLGAPGDVGHGGSFAATSGTGNSALIALISGVSGTANHLGTGLVSVLNGGQFYAFNGDFGGGTGTATQINGLEAQINAYAGTVGAASGIRVSTPSSTTGIQNLYGLIIENQGSGAKKWNIYSTGSGKNYFGGNVGIGNTVPSMSLHVGSASFTDGQALLRLEDANSTCDFNANAGGPTCGSDIRLKKDVTPLGENALDKLSALDVVTYHWKADSASASLQTGFIAQNVQSQFPDLVATSSWIDGQPALFLSMNGLIPHMVKGIQELSSKTTNLEQLMFADVGLNQPGPIEAIVDAVVQKLGDMILSVKGLIVPRVTTKELQMEDSATGQQYCVRIENGEFVKTTGECAEITPTPAIAPPSGTDPSPTASASSDFAPQASQSSDLVNTTTP